MYSLTEKLRCAVLFDRKEAKMCCLVRQGAEICCFV